MKKFIHKKRIYLFLVHLVELLMTTQLLNFKVKAIAGSANNQLLHESHGKMLQEKGILIRPRLYY